ncbi:MAG: hypothetical protein J6R37_05125 [Clostridia bacterium]|nr:hypothetical protein [Clostridia bacterium]
MRKLTIVRRKAFGGSLVSLKIYVEDPASNELVIDGVACKYVGFVNNGEYKTVEISDEAQKVFVIYDAKTKDTLKGVAQIEAGTEDVLLTGGCILDAKIGAPFVFDEVADQELFANSKPSTKKKDSALKILKVVFIILGFLAGFLFASALF